MATCPSCGHDNRDGAKFCEECATPLAGTPARAEERKVVTSLFCDLVGFTATSESADPEDVDRMLAAYFAMARAQIESHGGVVEKFIGDAVVGVFGVPAAHEDDPERAVRAGLRICEAAEELTSIGGEPLRLRVGINTGEALVLLGVAPGSGEGFLRGDAINTASRLQSVAPEMGVAVGLGTHEATAQVFDYEELEPATLKGKAEPVRVFWAKSPRARFGTDLTRTHDTPFIGREIDLALLKGIFDKTVAAESPQLVTVVGEPGLGKSRLVAELGAHIDTMPELVTWRQGRSLPYGENITFWALGEILKAHAGILESDDPATASDKLEAVLPDGPEREWFRQRLLPLLGTEATSSAGREELFTAWRRFLEHIAEQNPTVLVFEDLHWADPAMLGFLEHLADRAEAVPLLIVGTARPELFDRHPDYARGLRNTTSINLAPLSAEETGRLLAALLDTSVIPAELQAPILERAGGNPLYAEEFVRMLKDRDLVVRRGSSWEVARGAEIPFPDTVHALLAARLDTLTPERKALLADAAVVGKVFWAGALAAMGDVGEAEVVEAMHELTRKELVRPSRRSSMEGEAEYVFWHVLARDVAYSQIPRGARAARHVAAAAWIESKAPGRLEDLADVLAHHYVAALELAEAAGASDRAAELEASAIRFLTLAGERALGLDATAALEAFERALALTPRGHAQRPSMLARFGEAAFQVGRVADAIEALDEAVDGCRTAGDLRTAARAMGVLANAYSMVGDPRHWTLPGEAVAMLEPLGPSPGLVTALTELARAQTLGGQVEEGLATSERALALAGELALPRPARTLGVRAMARCELGNFDGLQDFRDAIELATKAGQGREVGNLYNNLGVELMLIEGPQACLEALRTGIEFARERGLAEIAAWSTMGLIDPLIDAGEFDEAAALAGRLMEESSASGHVEQLLLTRAELARMLVMRGQEQELAQVVGLLDQIETLVRESRDPQMMVAGLGSVALVRAAMGENAAAGRMLTELASFPGARETALYPKLLPMMARIAVDAGLPEVAASLAADYHTSYPFGRHSLVAAAAILGEGRREFEAASDAYAEAASRFEEIGVVPEEGFALLGQGRCLVQLGRPGEASEVLRLARAIFARLEMRPALDETDALLAEATALSS